MKIAICTPCYSGEVSCAFADSLITTLTSGPPEITRVWAKHTGCPDIALARAIVTAQAMAWGADKLFWIDADMSWRPEDFWRMAQAREEIVAAPYPMFTKEIDVNRPVQEQVRMCWRPLDEGEEIRGPLRSIHGTGLGFACISSEVFESMKQTAHKVSRPALSKAENAEMYDYFVHAHQGEEWCGTDFGFWYRARELGYNIWLDQSVSLKHHEGRMALASYAPEGR